MFKYPNHFNNFVTVLIYFTFKIIQIILFEIQCIPNIIIFRQSISRYIFGKKQFTDECLKIFTVKKVTKIFTKMNILIYEYSNLFEYPNIGYTLNQTPAEIKLLSVWLIGSQVHIRLPTISSRLGKILPTAPELQLPFQYIAVQCNV